MSPSVETRSRSYSVHGVRVAVQADDPAVHHAMELRLRGFPAVTGEGEPSLRFEFTSPEMPLTPSIGRPVYETPFGTLNYSPEQDLLTGELGGVALHCEPGAGRALIAAPEFTARSLYFATHPVSTVTLMELMERLQRFSLHVAALADAAGNGLLLAGPSGAGKSTLTIALACAGMEFLGDDIAFLERRPDDPGTIRALGFADAIGISPFASERFHELAELASQRADDGFPKPLHRFERLFGRQPMSSCTPRVIAFTEVASGAASMVEEIDRGEALLRLVPDVLLTHAAASQAHIAAIGQFLTQVRCYTVRSGHDIERAAELIRDRLRT